MVVMGIWVELNMYVCTLIYSIDKDMFWSLMVFDRRNYYFHRFSVN